MSRIFIYLVAFSCFYAHSFCATRELQFENEHVKVWKTTISAKDPLGMHRHERNRVVIGLQGGVLEKVEKTGGKSMIKIPSEKAIWFEKDPIGTLHSDANTSDEPIVVMVIELKE